MPLQKILFKPGVNRENTRYTTEGGWYECDKIRFRQGNPEVIGGWQQISAYTFLGVCRSMWNWVTLGFLNLLGVGTNLKFYIEKGGAYNDITPIRATTTLGTDPFTANGTTTVTVAATAHGCLTGDFVTFSGVTGIYASTLNAEFQVTVTSANAYTITTPSALAAGSYGGSAVVAAYQINTGPAYAVPYVGWGGGTWGTGTWGVGTVSTSDIRLWSQINYGEDLVFGPRGGGLYYWDATGTVNTRGVNLRSLGGTCTITIASPAVITSTVLYDEGAAISFSTTGALPTGITAGVTYYVLNPNGLSFNIQNSAGSVINTSGTQSGVQSIVPEDIPVVQNIITVSDTYRFLLVFGTNDYGSSVLDPMLIRWSNQNDIYNWTPDATNQAGYARISHGSEIVAIVQSRQEIVVLTDSAAYSLQYSGNAGQAWTPQLLGDNISIQGENAAVIASGVVYWMGVDKFYAYDGRIQTLNCDLRRYVFSDLNQTQHKQIFAGTNEGFNEVWWFYCSKDSLTVDKYVVYNYVEQVWYYGTLARTAWSDSGLRPFPQAATYSYNIVNHEDGINDNESGTAAPISAYISSSEFDIGDGHNFGFVWRILPDLTFENASTAPNGDQPKVTMELYGLTNSGSGVTSDAQQPVSKSSAYYITEEFTGQIYTRFRGRQMIFKISSDQINTTWQLGAPRIDIRPDGRR